MALASSDRSDRSDCMNGGGLWRKSSGLRVHKWRMFVLGVKIL